MCVEGRDLPPARRACMPARCHPAVWPGTPTVKSLGFRV